MSVLRVTSYGIIPLIQQQGGWKCFLVQHQKEGFWGFPKGHAEPGETSLQTAKRELFEETGLEVIKVLDEEPLIERYQYLQEGATVEKTVYFYLAMTSHSAQVDGKEIIQGQWYFLEQALEVISYQEGNQLLHRIQDRLSQKDLL